MVLDGDNPKSVIIYNDKWQLGPIKKKIDKFKKGKHNMTGHEEEEILLVFGLKSDNKSEYKSMEDRFKAWENRIGLTYLCIILYIIIIFCFPKYSYFSIYSFSKLLILFLFISLQM